MIGQRLMEKNIKIMYGAIYVHVNGPRFWVINRPGRGDENIRYDKILELKLGEELSLNEICKELNRLKILTPTNKEWDKPKLSSYYKTLKSDVGK